jgi:GTP cyclohydrolase I
MGEISKAIYRILQTIEPGDLRDGIKETPGRVERAMSELLDGYATDIPKLFKCFPNEGIDQIIAIKDIPFVSFCEHHLLPFQGTAHVAYLPNGQVIGASKIPRLVLAYAHRLQLQERITEQVAHSIMDYLKPKGVAVIVQAKHGCMQYRGVQATGSSMVTSVMLGEFRDNATTRAEVLSLLDFVGKQ